MVRARLIHEFQGMKVPGIRKTGRKIPMDTRHKLLVHRVNGLIQFEGMLLPERVAKNTMVLFSRLMRYARSGTTEDFDNAARLMNNRIHNFPKVFNELAVRYHNMNGQYFNFWKLGPLGTSRLTRNYRKRAVGNNRAEMAYVELRANERDMLTHAMYPHIQDMSARYHASMAELKELDAKTAELEAAGSPVEIRRHRNSRNHVLKKLSSSYALFQRYAKTVSTASKARVDDAAVEKLVAGERLEARQSILDYIVACHKRCEAHGYPVPKEDIEAVLASEGFTYAEFESGQVDRFGPGMSSSSMHVHELRAIVARRTQAFEDAAEAARKEGREPYLTVAEMLANKVAALSV